MESADVPPNQIWNPVKKEEHAPWLHKICWTDHYQDIEKVSCFVQCWIKGLSPPGAIWWLLNALKLLRSGAGTEGTSLPCISFWVAGPNFASTSNWRNKKVEILLHCMHCIVVSILCLWQLWGLRIQSDHGSVDRVPAWTKLACKDLAGNFSLKVKFSWPLRMESFWTRLQQTSAGFAIFHSLQNWEIGVFNGIMWEPPPSERYVMRHARPGP